MNRWRILSSIYLLACWLVATSCPVGAQALTVTRGYLIGTYDVTRPGSYIPTDGSTLDFDITQLPTRPDYVTAVAEAQIGIGSSCTYLDVTLNGVVSAFTGTPGVVNSLNNSGDCQNEGSKDERTYTTASVSATISSSQTSLPISIKFNSGGSNPNASNAQVRLLRLSFYSYTPSGGVIQSNISSSIFSGLSLDTTVKNLFGGYLVNVDSSPVGIVLVPTPGITNTVPPSARQLYFYLPTNSIYESALYLGTSQQQAGVTLSGYNTAGGTTNALVYNNPINLQPFNLTTVTGLLGTLRGQPKAPVLSIQSNTTTVSSTSGSNPITLHLQSSGISPSSLKICINNCSEPTALVQDGTPTWNNLFDNGSADLTYTLTGTYQKGQAIPIVITGQPVLNSQQTLQQSFILTAI